MIVQSGILTCLMLVFLGVDPMVQDPLDSFSAESTLDKNPGSNSGSVEWTVYEHEDFEKNELCMVLSCKKHELCLVRNNNAICARRQKLDEIEGKKKFYEPAHGHVHKTNGHYEKKHKLSHAHDEQEWDHQKLRNKMINYQAKLKNKHKNKVKGNLANEVHYENEMHHSNMPISSHERHNAKMGKYENCTDKELLAIKGRLYKWFSDIHSAQKQEKGYHLPKHEVKCDEDVGFMFSTLDGDTDAKLSVDELFSIDNDPYEKCIKPFLDRCDVNGDDVISINEWCDCFQWSNDDRHEPTCHAALRQHDPHDADSFFPNCDLEGYYKLDQCHKDFCWCVDKWGREFDRSRTRGQANCVHFAV